MKSFSDYIVNTRAMIFNINQYKKLNSKTKICAVVKADGYGLGIENFVAKIEKYVDFFAVACFLEAIKLRNLTDKPILILNFVAKENLQKCADKNISVSVFSLEHLKQIKRYVKHGNIKIHFAINTGMNRIGFDDTKRFKLCLQYACKLKNLMIEGIFTHFYNAISSADTNKQVCIFIHFLDIIKTFNFKGLIVHASASDASFLYENFGFDMVRLGICIYGYGGANVKLKQAVCINSKVINVCKVKKGESVGYGKNFVAKKDMVIATIPLGYADGIFRSYSKKGRVIINNTYCKIVGNICMDMFMCDVTNTGAKVGDNVIVLGANKYGKKITAEDIAKCCDTISYEILTNIKRNRFNIIKR